MDIAINVMNIKDILMVSTKREFWDDFTGISVGSTRL